LACLALAPPPDPAAEESYLDQLRTFAQALSPAFAAHKLATTHTYLVHLSRQASALGEHLRQEQGSWVVGWQGPEVSDLRNRPGPISAEHFLGLPGALTWNEVGREHPHG
jgi:hypothetical protein